MPRTPPTPLVPPADGSARRAWAARRRRMELDYRKTGRYGGRNTDQDYLLLPVLIAFECFLKAVGLYRRGVRNARNVVLREIDLSFGDLPEAFDGFTILHLSDLHLDGRGPVVQDMLDAWDGREVDLCVLTGDFRDRWRGSAAVALDGLRTIVASIASRHGFIGVLGNHDDCGMVAPMEAMGIRLLINESVAIDKGAQRLLLAGTDDVHYFHTHEAPGTFDGADGGFCIALVHSPELYDAAAERGVNLYLCGHTHGGQVCLPGGVPVVKQLYRGRAFYKGVWRHGGMTGLTHCGVGTTGLPVRFNTRGELLVLRLLRAPPGGMG